ncbi:BON domain-containing protein [Catenovulum sp. SM1970]|uniref:BON domain-containing protein n=1 Tax=Marinifaba aquimaris TaxID=2741323 RepID=UPI0015720A73|nr:BON domain-containing protein [Marinifaba aquimaris]NTS76609.1 BON domain-containing protein [Marinifaba aquimaris]
MKKFALLLSVLIMLPAIQGCAVVVVGAAAGAVMTAHDRRSMGAQVEDTEIEVKIGARIAEHQELGDRVNINVISYNRRVLLVGQAPSSHLKGLVERVAHSYEGVVEVHNRIKVKKKVSLDVTSNDAWLTSKSKTNLLAAENFDGSHIKVVTEDSEVFLMGIVTEQEAEEAINVVRHLRGVEKVIDVFEYRYD